MLSLWRAPPGDNQKTSVQNPEILLIPADAHKCSYESTQAKTVKLHTLCVLYAVHFLGSAEGLISHALSNRRLFSGAQWERMLYWSRERTWTRPWSTEERRCHEDGASWARDFCSTWIFRLNYAGVDSQREEPFTAHVRGTHLCLSRPMEGTAILHQRPKSVFIVEHTCQVLAKYTCSLHPNTGD